MLWVVRGDRSCAPGASSRVDFGGTVDPHGRRQRFGTGRPLHESLGMGGVRGQARAVPKTREDCRGAVRSSDGGRRQIGEPAVVVRIVVPREQIAADGARVCERAEPVRKRRPVLQGPELRFR